MPSNSMKTCKVKSRKTISLVEQEGGMTRSISGSSKKKQVDPERDLSKGEA